MGIGCCNSDAQFFSRAILHLFQPPVNYLFWIFLPLSLSLAIEIALSLEIGISLSLALSLSLGIALALFMGRLVLEYYLES